MDDVGDDVCVDDTLVDSVLVTVNVADDVGLDVMLVLCDVDRVVVRLDVGAQHEHHMLGWTLQK